MRYLFLFPLLLFLSPLGAQQGYEADTKAALHMMWRAKKKKHFREALDRYETAFAAYPDSIDALGLYKAAVLSDRVEDLDRGFDYLHRFLDRKLDDYGVPVFDYVLGRYAPKEYPRMMAHPDWAKVRTRALVQRTEFYDDLSRQERDFFAVGKSPRSPYLPKSRRNYTLRFPIPDADTTSYFVHLPPNYDPRKTYPLLVFLHGAVRSNNLADYQPTEILGDWNRFYTEYADRQGVILAFPKGSKQYNWMTPDDGFFLVPAMVKQIQNSLNVDPDRVYLTGHSNGATGSFSYLMKQPSLFAGFYGFNTHPKVYTGGTFAENARNRSYLNVSTDQDYYYPPAANDRMSTLMDSLGVDYRDLRYEGFPHWFPEFDESEPAVAEIFTDMRQRKRPVYPDRLVWSFDDDRYGAVDWLVNAKLDTTRPAAAWHHHPDFAITEWLSYNKKDELIASPVNKRAFDFPRASGKLAGSYHDNHFELRASRVKTFDLLLTPEAVDFERPVIVTVNGEERFRGRVKDQGPQPEADRSRNYRSRLRIEVPQ